MFFLILKGILGVILLYVGGEMLVNFASSLGRRLGLPDLLIGLTIVAFGTSAPELVASITAILKGSPGIVVGNVLGSNIANIGLILALTAMIRPFATGFKKNWKDFMFLASSSIFGGFLMLRGYVHPAEGIALLVMFFLYMGYLFRNNRNSSEKRQSSEDKRIRTFMPAVAGIIIGMALLPSGADLLVNSAIGVAVSLGVAEHVLGLTFVALGTSLPELVTSLVAAARRQGDMCLGNIIGSNIFNVLVVPGVCSIIGDLSYKPSIISLDIIFMLMISAAVIFFSSYGRYLTRGEGAFLFTGYIGYLIHLVH